MQSMQDSNIMIQESPSSKELILSVVKQSSNILIKRDLEVAEIRGWKDLHLAALWGLEQEVIRLIDQENFCVNMPDNILSTPLHLAAARGNTSCAQALLDRGAEINAQDKYQWTPLHTAYFHMPNMYHPCIILLLKHGASNDIKNSSNMTPLGLRDENRSWR